MVKKILSGEIPADSYFGMIRELDKEDDPHDTTKWVKPCPMFQNMDEYSQSIYDEMKDGSLIHSEFPPPGLKRLADSCTIVIG